MDQFGSMQNWMNGANGSGDDPNRRNNGQPERQSGQPVMQVCADVKPRLTKEQHDILEAHFQQQHKPSTSTKRQFAEHLGVPLDKINNWFQNRRAKVKQDAKKQLNALQMFHSNFSLPSHFVQPNVSTDHMAQPFYAHHQSMSQPNFSTEPIDSQRANNASNAQFQPVSAYNQTVPTILESTQPVSRDDVQNFDALGFPNMTSGGSAPAFVNFDGPVQAQQFADNQQFTFASGLTDFSGPLADISNGVNENFEFHNFVAATSAPMQPMESTSSTTSLPSNVTDVNSVHTGPSSMDNSPMPSLTSGFSVGEDRKPSATFSSGTHSDVGTDAPSSRSHTISQSPDPMSSQWVHQQNSEQFFASPNFYQLSNNSSHAMLPPHQEHGGIEHDQNSRPDFDLQTNFPSEAFMRRDSSTSQLTQSFRDVELQTPTNESEFKQPSAPVGLAARRQRPRPAALNNAALRSASYSNGMPSPNSNPALSSADQTLRRIRSSVASTGRISKPSCNSGQRSPLNFNFPADATAASPKYARHASLTTATGNSLAPPTPQTPSEFPRQFPPWQSHGTIKQVGKVENPNAEANLLDWQHFSNSGPYPIVTSPPTTPLDAEVAMQAHAQNPNQLHPRSHMRHLSLQRDTPPQSAPASQQTFPRSALVPAYQMVENQNMNEQVALVDKMSHLRRPSLPDAGLPMGLEHQIQWNIPEFDQFGEMQMNTAHLKPGMNPMLQYGMAQQIPRSFQNQPGASAAGHPSLVHPNFAVHEYSPPQGQVQKASSRSHARDNAPKVYHFANQGPRDFEH